MVLRCSLEQCNRVLLQCNLDTTTNFRKQLRIIYRTFAKCYYSKQGSQEINDCNSLTDHATVRTNCGRLENTKADKHKCP